MENPMKSETVATVQTQSNPNQLELLEKNQQARVVTLKQLESTENETRDILGRLPHPSLQGGDCFC